MLHVQLSFAALVVALLTVGTLAGAASPAGAQSVPAPAPAPTVAPPPSAPVLDIPSVQLVTDNTARNIIAVCDSASALAAVQPSPAPPAKLGAGPPAGAAAAGQVAPPASGAEALRGMLAAAVALTAVNNRDRAVNSRDGGGWQTQKPVASRTATHERKERDRARP